MLDKVLTLPLKKKPKKDRRQVREVRLQAREARRLARESRRQAREARLSRPARTDALTRALAWCVHLYTALGLVCAAAIAYELVQGGPEAFRLSFLLMAVATFIDGTDGTLARMIRIREVLPNFDGRRLDDITDFLTWTALPLVLVWRAGLMPHGMGWVLVVPLLASAYGFCQSGVKTDDGYFLGFPSLWNIVAFYLYVLQAPPWPALAVVLTLAVLTFVPSRYLYPTQPGKLNVVHNILAVVWAGMCGYVLWRLPDPDALRAGTGEPSVMAVARASLFYPAFYMGASWVVSVVYWVRRAKARAARPVPEEAQPVDVAAPGR
jgi:phosphatidylcholine synthase